MTLVHELSPAVWDVRAGKEPDPAGSLGNSSLTSLNHQALFSQVAPLLPLLSRALPSQSLPPILSFLYLLGMGVSSGLLREQPFAVWVDMRERGETH